ncbi:MAG: undecaprenyl-diphosphate phosphatase [Clostridia bacterium]|nr:undecaprenyl-diphosphate phosphatase [Clostridia bacterium]
MVSILCILLLGLLEGITEWLPVSSTGHLILLEDRLPLVMSSEFRDLFDVVIQLGAILAVLCLYREELDPFPKKGTDRSRTLRLWGCILVGVLPSAILGVLLDGWIFTHFFSPETVAIMLILWGVLFLLTELILKKRTPSVTSTEELTLGQSLLIGLWQVASLVPGTSRSGATVLGARLLGCSRECAARFSFFLAIPTMMGASLLKGIGFVMSGYRLSAEELLWLGAGTLTAFAVSMMTLRFLTDYVRRHGFSAFGIYRIALGILVLTDYFF